MSTKYKKAIILAATVCLILASYVIFNIKDKGQVENSPIVHDTTPPEQELEDWQKESIKEWKSKPVEVIHSKYGDFYYTANPKQYPRSQVADLDMEHEEVTKHTKQVIFNHFVYEKK